MIASSKEADSPTRQEGNTDDTKVGKGPSGSSPWLRLKDPRIVRVSRAFGGKDRHSKVCTIRGLRDRRVRLSVPTAIQLYDLQDRLGLNQPSKVVDWLLNAAKHEIDELPPLPIPPGHFALNPQMVLSTSQDAGASQTNKEGLKISSSVNWEDPAGGLSRSSFWSSDAFWRAKSKEVARETTNEKDIWNKRNEEEKHEGSEDHHGAKVNSSDHNILQRVHHSSFSGLLNNALPYGSYYHLEPSNFPLSHLGSHGFAAHAEELHNFNVVPLPSALSLSSGSQILLCPPGATQPLFPPHAAPSLEIDPRQQVNHFQMLSSGAQNLLPNSLNPPAYSISQSMIRPFHLSMTPRLLHSQNIGGQPDKEQEFPSK